MSLIKFSQQEDERSVSVGEIAGRMIEFARKHPYSNGEIIEPYTQRLNNGLKVGYIEKHGKCFLNLMRRERPPSQVEETFCKQAFFVPDDADRTTKRKDGFRRVVFVWSRCFRRIIWPAGAEWIGVIGDQWRRLDDGRIEAWYMDENELFWSVTMSKWFKEFEAEPVQAKPVQMYQGSLFDKENMDEEDYYYRG